VIRLLALDLDGTLLTKNQEIPPRTLAAIKSARTQGVRAVIVTGRMYRSAAPYAAKLGMEGLPLVSYNGAYVAEYPSNTPIFHEPVDVETARRCAAYCESQGIYIQAYVNDQICQPAYTDEARSYEELAGVKGHVVGPISEWLTEPSTKLVAVSSPERIARLREELSALLGEAANVTISIPTYLEVMSGRVSKGRALQAVAERLGVDRSEVMAIGDGLNDLEMIRFAGTGVAMGHAPAALKAEADYVTESGPGEGVWEALRHFGLIQA
jgi:Cof subfamily protein (haloacid dehalogenase superfamily)